MVLTKISFVLLLSLFGFYSEKAKSQYCGCSPILCCNQFGYCGISDADCGSGCRSGACRVSNKDSIDKIVTKEFFNGIIAQADNSCPGKRFYTRDSFIKAANEFFDSNSYVTRLEIATMFAHFTHESSHFCYVEELNGSSRDYCDASNDRYPCAPGKGYYGRGPIQLSWNFKYGVCGQSLGRNLLGRPELVNSDPTVAFETGLWWWTNEVSRSVLSQGFGATIRAINSLECNGWGPEAMNARISYYRDYCKQLGVDPGRNLSC